MTTRLIIAALALSIAACDRKSAGDEPGAPSADSAALTAGDSVVPNLPASAATGGYPGWLAATIGNVHAFDRSVAESEQIFEAELFPADSAARALRQGDTLRIVTTYRTTTAVVTEVLDREARNGVAVVFIRVHAPGLALAAEYPMAWVLPKGAPPVAGVQLSSVTGGDTARTWTTDAGRFFMLNRPMIAELVAVPNGGAPTPILSIKSDPAADRANGFERDSILSFNGPDPRIPDILEGFKFGDRGPWLFVVLVYGYECTNYRFVEIIGGAARLLEDPFHYYSCVV